MRIIMLCLLLAGCSSTGVSYFVERDKALVDVLYNCTNEKVKEFKPDTSVKGLVVGYVEVKGSLFKCQVISEEVIRVLGRN